MFLRNDHGLEQAGGTATLSFGRVIVPTVEGGSFDRLRAGIRRVDWVPDLGARIGSADWWRGVATCTALCATAWMFAPGFSQPIIGDAPAALSGSEGDEARAQTIAPLAWGADTGRRMAATDLVVPLAEAPERPIEERTATVGHGGGFIDNLRRAGLSALDADDAAALISSAIPLGDIKPGTQIPMTLGRRPDKTVARPLEALSLRARFDLVVSLKRVGNQLTVSREAIAVDHTPLRIQGLVGRGGLYRSARAAGVPGKIVEAYIKAIATRLSIGRDVNASDTFDIAIKQDRAATGEVQLGDLQMAGLYSDNRKTQLVKWDDGTWYEANGRAERQGFMGNPVNGHVTSTFGLRMHPILHYWRMHKGIDFGAPWGTPIYAAIDGVVQFAGRSSGYGNLVKLGHGGGIATAYGHMSRILVRSGQRVVRGQQIGAVGSTGESTGPHLHFEVLRGGVAVNPRGFSFSSVATLSGEALRAFRARVAGLLAVKPGTSAK